MKRFFSLALLLILFGSAAMYADPHMSFMGIPMNGNLSTFCGKLVSQKGLRIVERDDDKGVYTLSGKFAGYNNCEFYIFDNDDTHQVYQVDVYLPECTTWRSIKSQYTRIVRDYRSNSAYRFDEEEHEFEAPYSEGDGDEVAAVKADKINYHTDFWADGGLLVIRISRFMQVKLSFYDRQNIPGQDTGSTGSTGSTGGSSYATGNAMQFMGLPMVGNINAFAQQLVNQKGCRIVSTNDHSVSLRGKFTGKDCEIYVFGTQSSNRIWKVTVYLPKLSTWSSIKREYLNYKSQFDNKYTLTNSYDFFSDPYNEGDGREVEAVEADECHYSSFYDANGGNVMLAISKYMQVQMSYEDNVGLEVREREMNGGGSTSGGSFNDI